MGRGSRVRSAPNGMASEGFALEKIAFGGLDRPSRFSLLRRVLLLRALADIDVCYAWRPVPEQLSGITVSKTIIMYCSLKSLGA